jgi:hypothetical protein
VPGAPVGVGLRISRIRQGLMRPAPFIRRRRAVGRRAHERMAKPYSAVDFEKPGGPRGLERRAGDPDSLDRTPKKGRIAGRLRRRHQ